MNIESTVRFAHEHVAEYIDVLISTLVMPSTRFAPVEAGRDVTLLMGSRTLGPRLNPKLLIFVSISVVVGVTLNALLPGRERVPILAAEFVLAVVAWLFYGTFVHLLCRVLGGRGRYVDTMSVVLQVLATIYVVTAFLSLLAAPALISTIAGHSSGGVSREFFQTAITIVLHFFISTVLVAIYVPLAIRHVHGLDALRTVLAAAPAMAFVWWMVATSLESATGGFDALR